MSITIQGVWFWIIAIIIYLLIGGIPVSFYRVVNMDGGIASGIWAGVIGIVVLLLWPLALIFTIILFIFGGLWYLVGGAD